MRHKIILFILFALAASSCEYELDFSGYDQTRRLFVFGMPGSSDTTVVSLHSTIPMGDRNSLPLPLDDARVSLIVNGEEVVMERADETVPSLPEGSFYTLHPLEPGDKVEVKASAEGAEPVWAESVVPKVLLDSEVVMDVERNAGNYPTGLTFSVCFKDDPDVSDYYAMQVCLRKSYYSYSIDSGYEDMDKYEYEFLDYEAGSAYDDDLYPFQKPIIVNYDPSKGLYLHDNAHMVVFNENTFEKGEGVLEFFADYKEDSVESGYWLDGVLQEEKGYRCSYKVILYRLSSELYNFIRANEILDANLPILIGAAPPSYAFTNIRGGVGVFGGISKTETDWIPNVQ